MFRTLNSSTVSQHHWCCLPAVAWATARSDFNTWRHCGCFAGLIIRTFWLSWYYLKFLVSIRSRSKTLTQQWFCLVSVWHWQILDVLFSQSESFIDPQVQIMLHAVISAQQIRRTLPSSLRKLFPTQSDETADNQALVLPTLCAEGDLNTNHNY